MADILYYVLTPCCGRCCFPSWPLFLLSQMGPCHLSQRYLSHDNSNPLEVIGIMICHPCICCLPTGDKLYLSATGRIGSRLLLALANDVDAWACTFSFALSLFEKNCEIQHTNRKVQKRKRLQSIIYHKIKPYNSHSGQEIEYHQLYRSPAHAPTW